MTGEMSLHIKHIIWMFTLVRDCFPNLLDLQADEWVLPYYCGVSEFLPSPFNLLFTIQNQIYLIMKLIDSSVKTKF